MSFKPYTEKIKKKKIGICSILGRIPGSIIPEADQYDTDPKHCYNMCNEKGLESLDQLFVTKYTIYLSLHTHSCSQISKPFPRHTLNFEKNINL